MKRRWFAVLPLTLVALATPASASGQLTLSVPVDSYGADSSNVTASSGSLHLGQGEARAASTKMPLHTGIAVYEPNKLASPVNSVSATVQSTVPQGTELAVDVRGALPDGNWTEWTEVRSDAPAVLATPSSVVQVRLVLTAPDGVAGPSVRGVSLSLWNEANARPSAQIMAAGVSYRVYATREGLVGGTTANGHVITSRDHFVALPSRKGLSSKGTGNYSVQVCSSSGRCEWAPVWDVGPWNTTDDYWNASRQRWTDLPRGKPEAQAAYENNYNGGKDEFGREVANPAGIDLADGTFWDGVKLTTNSWVTVTYLWTGSGPSGFIKTSSDPLNVRSGANTTSSIVGLAANYAQVRVECQLTGESVSGSQGTSNIWFRIASGKYVAKAYVSGVSGATAC
jgi:hypothetical protein